MLGIVLRLAYFLIPRSYWGDEFFTIAASSKPFLQTLVPFDVHPPLQFVLFHFGCYRFIPLLSGLVSLYFFKKLAKDNLAFFLFAISPYFLHLSGETRGYGLLCMFSILALNGYKWAFPLALATEHYAWFLLLGIPLAAWYLPFLAGSGLMIYFQSATEGVTKLDRGWVWSVATVIKKLGGLWLQFMGGVEYSFLTTRQVIELPLLSKIHILGYFTPLVFLFKARNKKWWLLSAGTILLLFAFYPIRLNARYLPFCGVALIMLVVEGYRKTKTKLKHVVMAILIMCIMGSLLWMFTHHYDPYHKEDYILAAKLIENYDPKEYGLIGCREQVFMYTKNRYPEDGRKLIDCLVGNPDMAINLKHIAYREAQLGRKCVSVEKVSELTYLLLFDEKR